MNPETLMDVLSGFAALKVVPIVKVAVYLKKGFAALENEHLFGRLGPVVTSTCLRYQTAPTKTAWLEQINLNGKRTMARFQNGVLEPLAD